MNIEELYSVLLCDNPSKELLLNENKIFKLLPELKECIGFNQNNKWHIYDVYEHTLHVVDNVPNNLILRLAALFHDLGKPSSYKEDQNGVGHFYGHWVESKKIFDSFAKKHNIDSKIGTIVSNLIQYHDLSINIQNELEVEKLHNIFDTDGIIMLYEIKKADLLAQNEEYHYILKEYDKQKEKLLSKLNK